MVDLYSPRTEGESALLKSVMDYSGIPYYVRNDFFASLRVGPHIDLLNVKTFRIRPGVCGKAQPPLVG